LKYKLGEILKFNAGPNFTRISDKYPSNIFFTTSDIDNDLYQVDEDNKDISNIYRYDSLIENIEDYFTNVGDLVISIIKEKACVVGVKNANKCLSSAFIKCLFDKDKVDPWFICFFINESNTFKKEKYLRSGVTGLSYLHITSAILEQMVIDLPNIEEQHRLAKLYKDALKQAYLYQKKKDLLLKNINLVINNYQENIKGE